MQKIKFDQNTLKKDFKKNQEIKQNSKVETF